MVLNHNTLPSSSQKPSFSLPSPQPIAWRCTIITISWSRPWWSFLAKPSFSFAISTTHCSAMHHHHHLIKTMIIISCKAPSKPPRPSLLALPAAGAAFTLQEPAYLFKASPLGKKEGRAFLRACLPSPSKPFHLWTLLQNRHCRTGSS